MFKRHSRNKHYWFTIQSPNGQTLATSETYTTAAMRDKGIEAVKKVVKAEDAGDRIAKAIVNNEGEFKIGGKKVKTTGSGWKVSQVKSRKPSDTFHLENKHGKITKR